MTRLLVPLLAMAVAAGAASYAGAQYKDSPIPPEAAVVRIPPDNPLTLEQRLTKAGLLYHIERREVLRLRALLRARGCR